MYLTKKKKKKKKKTKQKKKKRYDLIIKSKKLMPTIGKLISTPYRRCLVIFAVDVAAVGMIHNYEVF
jgi:hypothetical protein